MLITASFGTANTGLPVYYTVLNEDKSVYQSRRNTGITELTAGSGTYGVNVALATIAGKTVVWDIDATAKTATETFDDLTNLDAAVSTRLATSSYTAPPTTGDITNVLTNYDVATVSDIPTDYMTNTDATVAAIDAQTSQMVFTTPGKIDATAEATVDEQAIADAVVAALPPLEDGFLVTPNTIGTDSEPIGRVMPYGVVTVYLGADAEYRFDADADGDFSYRLPYGSVWTLIGRKSGYQDTTAEVSTVV